MVQNNKWDSKNNFDYKKHIYQHKIKDKFYRHAKSEQSHQPSEQNKTKWKYSQTLENFLQYLQECLQLQAPTSPMDLPAYKAKCKYRTRNKHISGN